ncbi:MAG: hypothetical protein ACI8O8_001435 [Oleiphilaceae bacterium]|jgi:hypothetical protein
MTLVSTTQAQEKGRQIIKYNNILETIGNTPYVRINSLFRIDIEV